MTLAETRSRHRRWDQLVAIRNCQEQRPDLLVEIHRRLRTQDPLGESHSRQQIRACWWLAGNHRIGCLIQRRFIILEIERKYFITRLVDILWSRWAGLVMLGGRWSWWRFDQAQNINKDSILSLVFPLSPRGDTLSALLSSYDLNVLSSSFI